jgi:hypothetical protein
MGREKTAQDSTTSASKKKFDVWILDFVDRHLLSRVDLAYRYLK